MATSQAQSPDDITRLDLGLAFHKQSISCMAWLPDERIVTGSSDYIMRIWNWTTGEQEGSPMLHQGQLLGIIPTKDGRIISWGSGTSLMVWNVATQELLHHAYANMDYGFTEDIVLSPNEDLLVSYHWRRIVFWEVEQTIQVRNHIDPQQTTSVPQSSGHTLSFSPDGKRLATCYDEAEVNIFDVESGERIFGPFRDKEHLNGIGAITWSPDGGRLLCGCIDGSIRHLDPCTGETGIRLKALWGSSSNAIYMSFSRGGKWLASSSPDWATVGLWDTESGDPAGEPVHLGSDFRVSTITFSRSGQHIACCGPDSGDNWRLFILPVSRASKDSQQVLQSFLDQPAIVSSDGRSHAREIDIDFLDISAPRPHRPLQNSSRQNPSDERPRMRSSMVSWKWWKRIPRLVLDRPSPVYMGRAEPRTYVASRHTADTSSNSLSQRISTPASSEGGPNATMIVESSAGESNEKSMTDAPLDDVEVGRAGCCGLLSRPSRQPHAPRQRRDVSAPRSAHPTRPPNSADTATPRPPIYTSRCPRYSGPFSRCMILRYPS